MNQPIGDRLKGTSPEAIDSREQSGNQQVARDRELSRWYERANKPMMEFEGTLTDITQEERSGVRQSGDEWSSEVAVCHWSDVRVLRGTEMPTTEFRLPDAGKDFSRYSEPAITVRKAIEAGANVTNFWDFIGKKLHLTGNWEPTFQTDAKDGSGRKFWSGTYYYDVKVLGEAAATNGKVQATIDPANLNLLVEYCSGLTRKELTAPLLLKQIQLLKIKDEALTNLVVDGNFLFQCLEQGVLSESVEGVFSKE